MKKIILTIAPLACALFATTLIADTESKEPVGTLSLDANTAFQGSFTNLSWDITYPPERVFEEDEDGNPKTTVETIATVKVIGVGLSSGLSADLDLRFSNRGSWENVFYGKGSNVQPDKALIQREVPAGTSVEFRGRVNNGTFRSSGHGQHNVIVLTNGDDVPNITAFQNQSDVAAFLNQYIDENNKIVLNENSVIFTSELYTTNQGSRYFDLQDGVVLVEFETVTE